MSILSVVDSLESAIIEDAQVLITKLETVLKSEAQKVIAAAANTDFGTTILNLMSAVENHGLTGAQKMTEVVAAGIKIGTEFLAAGGWSGAFAAAETFLSGVVQFLFADFEKAFAPKVV